MENYIVINGKKAELTEEQLKALGIEIKKKSGVWERKDEGVYYYISPDGVVSSFYDKHMTYDNKMYNVANYCTDKAPMERRALHETLNRLLWRFSMEHDGDKIDWNDPSQDKWLVRFDIEKRSFVSAWVNWHKQLDIYFYTREIAEQAIEKVIKPFMAEHPDFKW